MIALMLISRLWSQLEIKLPTCKRIVAAALRPHDGIVDYHLGAPGLVVDVAHLTSRVIHEALALPSSLALDLADAWRRHRAHGRGYRRRYLGRRFVARTCCRQCGQIGQNFPIWAIF